MCQVLHFFSCLFWLWLFFFFSIYLFLLLLVSLVFHAPSNFSVIWENSEGDKQLRLSLAQTFNPEFQMLTKHSSKTA